MHLVYGNRIVSERLLSDVSRNSLLYVFTRTYLIIIFFAIYYHSENETYGNSEIFFMLSPFCGLLSQYTRTQSRLDSLAFKLETRFD